MAEYKLYNVVPALFEFIEDLTNWYIRLNRSRYWSESMTADKAAAYQTLYAVLNELNISLAPFAPFLSEHIYQELLAFAPLNTEYPQSVHLCTYPEADESMIQPKLEAAVARMQSIILLGRQKREQVKIKTKIPLARLTIIHEDQGMLDEIARLESYIRTELNVKSIDYSTEEDAYINLYAKPNSAILGKRLGKDFKHYKNLIENLTVKELKHLQDDDAIKLENESFTTQDILVFREAKSGTEAVSDRFITIDLDIQLTDTLLREGLAREIVNRIQKTRKDLNLNVADRIKVIYQADTELEHAISEHRDYIARETLCTDLNTSSSEKSDLQHDFDIDGQQLSLNIERVN